MTKPNTLHDRLFRWYEQNKRVLPWRETTDPYKIWLSEVILQQTRVQQGMDYYHRFVARFPDVRSLAEAEEDEVLLLWQGLGYYSRARNLHKAAKMVVEKGWDPFPDTFEDVRSLPGIGEYTAAGRKTPSPARLRPRLRPLSRFRTHQDEHRPDHADPGPAGP